jgi:hypothetical protein
LEHAAETPKGQPSVICAVGLVLSVFTLTIAWFAHAMVSDNLRNAGVKEFPIGIEILFGPLFGVATVVICGLFLIGVLLGKRAGGVVGWFGMLLLLGWTAILVLSISLLWRAASGA